MGLLALSAFVVSATSIASVRAEDQPDNSMQGMKGMQGMQGMHEMHDMDHMKHQQQLSARGTYTSSPLTVTIPQVKLVDTNGKELQLSELLNDHSAIILNFIFTTCTTICPVMSATFQQIQNKLGVDRKDVHLVSISIDPENDTPAKLKAYADKFKAGAQWTLLTGTLENSLTAQKAFGVFAGEKMNHKPITFLKAKGSNSQWIMLEGLAEADQIIKEYDKLSSGK